MKSATQLIGKVFCVNHVFAFFLSICALSSICLAQDEPESSEDTRYENWYQIELIVFERLNSSTQETWPNNVSLGYPESINHLFTEEEWANFIAAQEAADLRAQEQLGNELEFTQSAANSSPESIETDLSPPKESQDSQSLTETLPETNSDSIDLTTSTIENETDLVEAQVLPALETPRITLKSDERSLNNESKRLERRSAYRVLFHQAWRQELNNSEESKAIPLAGGALIDAHHELEGWVKISLNRFLHFESHLWRVNYELNYGQSKEYWPEIPKFPKPQIINSEEETQSAKLADIGFSQYYQEAAPLFSIDKVKLESSTPLTSYETIEKSPYLVTEVVTLSQKRRMRSEELHYIDHPRLGILIKVNPYSVMLKPDLVKAELENNLGEE